MLLQIYPSPFNPFLLFKSHVTFQYHDGYLFVVTLSTFPLVLLFKKERKLKDGLNCNNRNLMMRRLSLVLCTHLNHKRSGYIRDINRVTVVFTALQQKEVQKDQTILEFNHLQLKRTKQF